MGFFDGRDISVSGRESFPSSFHKITTKMTVPPTDSCGILHKRQFGFHRLPSALSPHLLLYTNQSVDLQTGHLGFHLPLLLEHGEQIHREGDALQNVLGLLDAGPDDGHQLGNGRVDDVLVDAGDVMEDLLVERRGVLAAGGFGNDGHGGRLVQAEDGPGEGEAAAPRPGVLGTLVDAALMGEV